MPLTPAHLSRSHSRTLPRSLRVCLVTDTLGDVNGVSRFIRTIGTHAAHTGRDLHIITSTRFDCPSEPFIHNIAPRLARPMPGYPNLDIVIPRASALNRCLAHLAPDVIHISTPGPVGSLGRRHALRHNIPLVATYHTDFPAYIAHLFGDDALTWVTTRFMRRFYAPFHRIFTRSHQYRAALRTLGVEADAIIPLAAGIDTEAFSPNFTDPSGKCWHSCPGVRPRALKVLSVGRISIEKNLPLLVRLWPRVVASCSARTIDVQLLIVGDGPYRATMAAQLAQAAPADSFVFLGFRHAQELSTIYASSDLFVFPSTTDTLGQVALEAQASGLPVLVSDQGGPREYVDHECNGLILPVRAGAERMWADALVSLAIDAPRRIAMSRAAAAKVAPLSIRHTLDQFWAVHDDLARERASARA